MSEIYEVDIPDADLVRERDYAYENFYDVTPDKYYLVHPGSPVRWFQGKDTLGSIQEHEDWMEIKSIFVREKTRGTGMGAKLVRTLMAEAKGRDIYLETSNRMVVAIALYEGLGFVKCDPFDGRSHFGGNMFMHYAE